MGRVSVGMMRRKTRREQSYLPWTVGVVAGAEDHLEGEVVDHLPGGRVTGHEVVAEEDAEDEGAGAEDVCLLM